MSEPKVTMSWQQIVWAVATIATILGGWYDTRAQMALLRQELALRVQQEEFEHVRMWRAIDQATVLSRRAMVEGGTP